jgi:AraC family transcriptional regulator, arabinose operon regulatory protein
MKYDHYLINNQHKWEQTWVYRPFPQQRYNFPLLLQMAGYARWGPGESYTRTHSTDFFVEYVCRGNVELRQNGRHYLIEPGEVYLLRKGVSHTYSTGPAGVVVKRFVQVAGSGIDHYLRALDLWNQDHIRPAEPQVVKHLLKQATTILARSPSEADAQLDVQLSCLMYQILLELNRAIQPSIPPVVEKALTFMHENLHRTLTRQEICAQVGLSMPHFNRLFSNYMHCTPIAYFLEQKYNWTVRLLKTTALSIKEIAYRVGFEDPLYFSAQFKKRFGVSPKDYRRHEKDLSKRRSQREYHPCNISWLHR